ncbi:MAG: PepQ-3 X-pro aminopeptidase [Candidatus Magasanikbacteria bacterium GW2011_GWA2_56_11]|uniref:PepQ-3 X-pro aminopeptidase n=1 Tax=Candidatus Magasanikbacteria bacterium GW2011_GWA2_56_11 TaxID=1619044 RepID=A0A0G2B833_9BACT|nr:MAG: PepQ-3 X-pro aminopeptidase [Candidatus Magasanikbacteria bacterium GW2011_GWA2_56_11]
MMLTKKLRSLRALVKQQSGDALIVGNFGHETADDILYYLLLQRLESGLLYLPSSGRPKLFVTPFEARQWQKKYPELSVLPWRKPLERLLGSALAGKTIAVRAGSLPCLIRARLAEYPKVKLKNLSAEEKVMAVKLPEEIVCLKRAAALTDKLFSELIQNWSRFSTETAAARFLLTRMAALYVEPSFPPIIASGANAANPHHETAAVKIKRGFCVIDMGVRYRGYCSDMTRTIYVGKPAAKETALYDRVRRAQETTVGLVKPGITTPELDRHCRESLGELNCEFIHGLGHGVGTQVHEWPRVGSADKVVLEENMLITIEPGVYRRGHYGIRIEDDVLVTKSGRRVLTRASRDLIRPV